MVHNFKMYNIGDYNNEINALRNDLSKKPKEVTKVVEDCRKTERC